MKRLRPLLKYSIWLMAGLLVFAISPAQARDERPYNRVEPFDFADDFYNENGINPDNLIDRLVGDDARSVVDTSPHEDFTDVRILEITGGFRHNGDIIYYTVNSKFNENVFTADDAGLDAEDTANAFVAYIFPQASGPQFVPRFTNRRQDNVFDTRGGYFSNNPLGLWRLAFVKWVDVGDTPDPEKCQDLRDDLMEENGPDLDGTPIIETVSDLETLDNNGCILIRSRNPDGSFPTLRPGEIGGPEILFRWVV